MAERIAITDKMTARDLHDARSPRSVPDLMVRAMGALERGKLQFTKQSEQGVTYANKIDKAEARIDWTKIRALEAFFAIPWPVAVSWRVLVRTCIIEGRTEGSYQGLALYQKIDKGARVASDKSSQQDSRSPAGTALINILEIAALLASVADERG